jgi:hypothetical protein
MTVAANFGIGIGSAPTWSHEKLVFQVGGAHQILASGRFVSREDIMTRMAGWMMAGVILVAMGSTAQAQVGISIGNPYRGGVVVGTPGYGYAGYNPNYGAGATYYSSGYAGYAPVAVYRRPYVAPYAAYGYRPYRNYGYGPYRRWGGRR